MGFSNDDFEYALKYFNSKVGPTSVKTLDNGLIITTIVWQYDLNRSFSTNLGGDTNYSGNIQVFYSPSASVYDVVGTLDFTAIKDETYYQNFLHHMSNKFGDNGNFGYYKANERGDISLTFGGIKDCTVDTLFGVVDVINSGMLQSSFAHFFSLFDNKLTAIKNAKIGRKIKPID